MGVISPAILCNNCRSTWSCPIRSGDTHVPTNVFTYSYLPNSHLIEKVTSPVHTATNEWSTNRDVLTARKNKVGTKSVSQYLYQVNAIGQRTKIFDAVWLDGATSAPLRQTLIGYDTLGQVISADSSINTKDRAYQYDTIGNRKKSADSLTLPSTDNYTSNALNQYSSITLNHQLSTRPTTKTAT